MGCVILSVVEESGEGEETSFNYAQDENSFYICQSLIFNTVPNEPNPSVSDELKTEVQFRKEFI